jgi:hypothetical protein
MRAMLPAPLKGEPRFAVSLFIALVLIVEGRIKQKNGILMKALVRRTVSNILKKEKKALKCSSSTTHPGTIVSSKTLA